MPVQGTNLHAMWLAMCAGHVGMLHAGLASSQHHALPILHLTTINANVAAVLEGQPGAATLPRQMGAWCGVGEWPCL